jgi:hypothetical protein
VEESAGLGWNYQMVGDRRGLYEVGTTKGWVCRVVEKDSHWLRSSTGVGGMDTGVSRSTCSWAPSSAHLQPRG